MQLSNLDTRFLGHQTILLDSVDSTNQFLKERADMLENGTAVIAREQSQGRGRRGNRWLSEKDSALFLSFLLKDLSAEDVSVLPLLCGLACADALTSLSGVSVGIKWPNDLIAKEKKLAGILCESRIMGGKLFAVCGIGVNLMQSKEDFLKNGLPYAVSLKSCCGKTVLAKTAAARILNETEAIYNRYKRDGMSKLLKQLSEKCVTLNQTVQVIRDGEALTAFAKSIAPDGALICEKIDTGEEIRVLAGEVSVRGLYGYFR